MYKVIECRVETLMSPGFRESDDSEEVILEPKLIAAEYMRTWFFLDLLSSLPVDYIFLILDSGLFDSNMVRSSS